MGIQGKIIHCEKCGIIYTKQTKNIEDLSCNKCKTVIKNLMKEYNMDKYQINRVLKNSDFDKYSWRSAHKGNNIFILIPKIVI